MNKVIVFLDFDGVLNSINTILNSDCEKQIPFDEESIKSLKKIIEAYPEVRFVISSSWRKVYSLEQIKEQMKQQGIEPSLILGVTSPNLSKDKSIEEWILNKRPNRFIILDDDVLFDLGHKFFSNQVKTNGFRGLTNQEIKEIEKYILKED